MGALKEIQDAYPAVEIFCSPAQKKFVIGEERSLRVDQLERLHETLPESKREENKKFQEFILAVQKVDHVTTVKGGDSFPWCGGIEIIDTKGHMPGHISIYVRKEKALIAGDALIVEGDKLSMPDPRYTLDQDEAYVSIKNLLDYDIQQIICYHGGIYTGDIKSSLQRILESWKR